MSVAEKNKTEVKLPMDSLEIKGYRAFKELTIPKLARVNLITGKNNIGKTSLLEALWLYSSRSSTDILRKILINRDALIPNGDERISEPRSEDIAYANFLSLVNFDDATANADKFAVTVEIGPLSDADNVLSIRFLKSREPVDSANLNEVVTGQAVVGGVDTIYIDVSQGRSGYRIPLRSILRSEHRLLASLGKGYSVEYIPPSGLSNASMGILWDAVSLTQGESDTIRALQLIDPRIQRVNLIGEPGSSHRRISMARVSDAKAPIPLKQLGDGVNRLFSLSLALVTVENGVLLIDEIENGLHYSVLINVWKIIFELAHRLNVQVFATTHSWECIEAFQLAAAVNDLNDVALIRLQRKNGTIFATVLDENELTVVTRDQLEVR